MKILCISDLHQKQKELSLVSCDVLIISGDICNSGDISELQNFIDWLSTESSKFNKAILIAGNHDWCFMQHRKLCLDMLKIYFDDKVVYLEDSDVVINGVKFYGSPWQPIFNNWAFTLPRGERLKRIWSNIPDDVNVLITHGPPHGIGDLVNNRHTGCLDLAERIRLLPSMSLHIFGHIHSGNGHYISDGLPGIVFCNAAICTEAYQPENPAYEIDLNLEIPSMPSCNIINLRTKNE